MRGFEYGNTRLRGMKARLLTASELDRLSKEGDLDALSDSLTDTAYAESMEVGLAYAGGRAAIMYALREEMKRVFDKIRGFYQGEIREMVMLSLRHYDIFNLKTILRGLDAGLPFDEIRRSLLPIGELSLPVLEELARAGDPRGAIDRMATLQMGHARPLLRLRRERPGAEVYEMEIALSQWHFEHAQEILLGAARKFEPMREAVAMDADISNIMTALRFAAAGLEIDDITRWKHDDTALWPFVPSGKLEIEQLKSATESGNVAEAVEQLAVQPYQAALLTGLEDYRRTGRLSEIESALMEYRLSWRASLIMEDPLGIGVSLAYIGLKVNEIQNLRRITIGIELGLPAEDIWESVVLPS
jgi:V/A-type H+-transporting ATPase subunit C